MMRAMGAVDSNTPIVTTVHDCQVYDTLPERLFDFRHDVTVDYICTPTRIIKSVIDNCCNFDYYFTFLHKSIFLLITILHFSHCRCTGNYEKPNGIVWSLLTEDQVRKMPILQILRKSEQEKGIDVSLKL